LSIVIDQQKNIERALKRVDPRDLYKELENLPEDFLFSVYLVFTTAPGIRSYKPILRVPIGDINVDFLDWLIKFAKKNRYKTPINISRKIWNIDEFLSWSKHLERAREVMKHLELLKQYFEKL